MRVGEENRNPHAREVVHPHMAFSAANKTRRNLAAIETPIAMLNLWWAAGEPSHVSKSGALINDHRTPPLQHVCPSDIPPCEVGPCLPSSLSFFYSTSFLNIDICIFYPCIQLHAYIPITTPFCINQCPQNLH